MNTDSKTGLLTRNKITQIAEADHLQQHNYLETIRAFARLTYESVYVIDYEKMGFEYVSDNPLFLSGYIAEQVLEMGYEFYFKNVPEKDLQMLGAINQAGFDFFDKVPLNERKQYSITYDFHLINKDGKPILINHKLTPLFLTASGKMWKAVCVVSISHHRQAGNTFITKQGTDKIWQLNIETGTWHKFVKPELTKRETEVLRLHAQGLTINQIAEKIFVSPDTVKYYRRRIFERLNVSNIAEALAYAVNSKMI
ncbi:helix-turn-helix transcriptional regulator [Mucilaginibacter sp. JRF]|uniref:response regulator transcription factor n=1 Tax=Mucilaginibacter sp. JRF TaxID=2780088 RepID=UPI001881A19F|nr:helix-turn-helix transcriptional regulator [Mucilaginibacter sp. JRF]MBE9584139.1 helix-turn-helix transcriptional regulator [Mucilaginibacter sp. JRF]